MDILINFLAQILAPLSVGIVITAIAAGLFMGSFYNYQLKIQESLVFHKAVAGWAFIAFIFMFRVATALATPGAEVPNFLGWIGIGMLWGIYCGSIYVGERLVKKVLKRQRLLG